MNRTKATIEERLRRAQVAISSALTDPTLQAALANYGYDVSRLHEGQHLRDTAHALYQQQKDGYGNLRKAKDARATAYMQAQETYARYLTVAKVAFKRDRGTLHKLYPPVRRNYTIAGWLARTRQFYTSALSDPHALSALARYGITSEMLEAGARQIDTVEACNVTQQQCKGAAQDATRMRNLAMVDLDEWLRDFKTIARIALNERPQFLEKLGMTVHR